MSRKGSLHGTLVQTSFCMSPSMSMGEWVFLATYDNGYSDQWRWNGLEVAKAVVTVMAKIRTLTSELNSDGDGRPHCCSVGSAPCLPVSDSYQARIHDDHNTKNQANKTYLYKLFHVGRIRSYMILSLALEHSVQSSHQTAFLARTSDE